MFFRFLGGWFGAVLIGVFLTPQSAAGEPFTWQGRLNQNGSAADGNYDFAFGLYDSAAGGAQVGTTVTRSTVPVSGGLFSVELDFGDGAFDGSPRWLETTVAPAGSGDVTPLAPRTAVTGAPYAAFALRTAPVGQTRVVAKSGGDFTSIQAAIDSITDASESKPWVIRVAPGVYTEKVTLKPWISLEGMSPQAVIVRWTGGDGGGLSTNAHATLTPAENTEVRNLTVESDGTGKEAALAIGIESSTVTLSGVTARAWGGTFCGAIRNVAPAVRIENCTLSAAGDTYTVALALPGGEDVDSRISHCELNADGGTSISIGLLCNDTSAPVLSDSRIEVQGPTEAVGVLTMGAGGPVVSGCRILARGGQTLTTALYSFGGPFLEVTDSVCSATESVIDCHGLVADNGASGVVARNSRFEGFNSGAVLIGASSAVFTECEMVGASAGLAAMESTTVMATRCVIEGTFGIFTSSPASVKVAHSQITGTVPSGIVCLGNYDADLNPIDCSPTP